MFHLMVLVLEDVQLPSFSFAVKRQKMCVYFLYTPTRIDNSVFVCLFVCLFLIIKLFKQINYSIYQYICFN